MDASVRAAIAEAVEELRAHRAQFAYLHGSQASGYAAAGADVDVAAFFAREDLLASDLVLPRSVDLLVLDTAPLEIAGRIAATGRLLFEADAVARVRWEAMTRKIYFDERPRFERAHREFLESVRHG
ncbi:nucleotidyltransferase domain-containing protein [Ruania zhangjianzhongii]|uniref:nucleotidyltransferase domain-containing protein n=1 Tax=Ruania zhangjianzhongii TaxID=2603206 RepID=UPI0011C7DCFD|nr:nucleotidyltransferase domain-containing protein [Ruania zhangjianzhongii]